MNFTFIKLGYHVGDFYVSDELQIVLVVVGVFILIILWPNKNSKKQNEISKSVIDKRKSNYQSSPSDNFLEMNLSKIQKSIKKQINKSYLTGVSWILLNSEDNLVLYTFKNSGELMITNEGDVRIASYDMLNDNQSIIIRDISIEHFEIKLAKDNLLLLSKFGKSDNVLLFGNYTKFNNKSKRYIEGYLSQYLYSS